MPVESPSSYADEPNLYPRSSAEHDRLLSEVLGWFQAAKTARQPFEDRWTRYYKLYRSYRKRKTGDWRSHVFVPISFWVVETVAPRLVAQMPKPVVLPVGAEDVEPAKVLEELLGWSFDNSGVYLELVKAIKSALKYGTGIMKTYHDVRERTRKRRVPVTQPVFLEEPAIDPDTGAPMIDPDGNPVMQSLPAGEEPVLGPDGQEQTKTIRESFTAYDGPTAEWVDIFNFWPAPEADDIDGARYVIHRVFRDMKYVRKLIDQGVYRYPEGLTENDLTSESDPASQRLDEVELGSPTDTGRGAVEILEIATDDRIITVLNQKAIVRVSENPFEHGEKPFVRVVDHLVEGEFWGIGEIEVLEGLQDFTNALVNQRIDNLRLVLNAMFAVNVNNLEDPRDLQIRPGGTIRVKDGLPQEVVHRLDLGDVTSSAYQEVAEAERMIEKVSAVSAYQTGIDSPTLNKTATGVAIIQEQGATRFSLKTKLAELTGYRRLARHFGSILQQFWPAERVVRMTGPAGQFVWQNFSADSLQGALDYQIESESSTQTESMRQQQAMSLLQVLGAMPGINPLALVEDVLRTFGKKDMNKYLLTAGPEVGPDPLAGQLGADPAALNGEAPPDLLAALSSAPPAGE